jgi:tartrate dehydrogenase/decarboxylase/D-malate dehydrogenase
MHDKRRALKVGLAVGGGTGPELAEVFERTLARMTDAHGAAFEIVRSARCYRTYVDVAIQTPAAAAAAAAEDARAYEDFLLELARKDVPAVFRTAFNAESIYLARERLRSVKIEPLPFAQGHFLLVRDQAQGFYSGGNNAPASSPDVIVRSCEFRRDVTERVLDFALLEAAAMWGPEETKRIVLVYKFHLLDNRFAGWIAAFARARSLRIELLQPDTMNRRVLRDEFRGNVLVVGSNEWLDIAHAELLARHGGLVQDERCTRNVYLDPRLEGLVEYQTVHGSADDIAGRGVVNPLAAMRSAAAIAERCGACLGATTRLEEAIAAARRTIPSTESTSLVAERVLERYRASAEQAWSRGIKYSRIKRRVAG